MLVVVLLVTLFLAVSFGQPALIREPVGGAVRTYLGSSQATVQPVTPNQDLLVAVLADQLSEEDLKRLRAGLLAFHQANRSAPLRIAVVTGQNIQFAGPFRTRQQLQAALREMQSAASPAAEPVNAARFYTFLASLAPRMGADWSAVVLAARWPAIDPALREYAQTFLSLPFRAQRVRVAIWSPGESPHEAMAAVSSSTGVPASPTQLEDLLESFLAPAEGLAEVSWPSPAIGGGFRIYAADLGGASVPAAALSTGAQLPDIETYGLLRQRVREAGEILSAPDPGPEKTRAAIGFLAEALRINSRDGEALDLSVGLYRRHKDYKTVAALLTVRTELIPPDGELFADLGRNRFLAGDGAGAETALMRARELNAGGAQVAEDLAHILLGRKDDRGALPFLEESLAAGPANRPLWFLRAEVSERLGDWKRQADSVERALALGDDRLDARTKLVRLYLDRGAPAQALPHVRLVAAKLPDAAAVRATYAGFLDELRLPEEALAAWRQTIQSDPASETAHYRVTRLLIGKDALPDALKAAENGIEAAPQSARLHLAKSEIEEKGDFYLARRTLRRFAPSTKDIPLLTRIAEMEDESGPEAARWYRALAEALPADRVEQKKQTLDRGLAVSLRDGDAGQTAWFAAQLQPGPAAGSSETATASAGVWVPGGTAALAFIARSRETSSGRFLVDYADALASRTDLAVVKRTMLSVQEHFKRVAALQAAGPRKGNRTLLALSVKDKKAAKDAERILDLLGWRMRSSKGGVTLEAAEKGDKAKRQETASALAIDEVGMQAALEEGKPFQIEIQDDWVPVLFGEQAWRSQFYSKAATPGGLPEAMAIDQRLAAVYAGLSAMDLKTASMIAAPGLKTLVEKYSGLLHRYASAIVLESGRAAVPGGPPADPSWIKLAGADPRQPSAFFAALLAKDDGRLLQFYATLAQLDAGHQRFFTRTPQRTAKFYELFRDAPEMETKAGGFLRNSAFIEFLGEVPLDGQGNVDFPGSPEVWMVVKGHSGSVNRAAKMLKKVKKSVAPDVEDEILLRLARIRYSIGAGKRTELDNFVALTRLDAHRSEPLDEAAAVILAQNFAIHEAAFPYFDVITGLQSQDYQSFFSLADKLQPLPTLDQNPIVGLLHALIEIVSIGQQTESLTEDQAAGLFRKLCERFLAAGSPAEYGRAALDLTREILSHAPSGENGPDAAMRVFLLKRRPPSWIEVNGAAREVDFSKTRHADFIHVLEIQKAPPLAALLAMDDAAKKLASLAGPPALQIKALESAASGLAELEIPKTSRGREKHLLESFQTRQLIQTLSRIRQRTAKKKLNPKDLEGPIQELMTELAPQIELALAGIVYAFYLRPGDLVVSEDPLLLRKHQFVEVSAAVKSRSVFLAPYMSSGNEQWASRLSGGFASFAELAGQLTASTARLMEESLEPTARSQIGSLRTTDWSKLQDGDLRLASLKILVAREWVVRSAAANALREGLAVDTLGLLSLTRRADLLHGIGAEGWKTVWKALTLSDLYFLGDRYLQRFAADPWQSPVTRALRRHVAVNDGARLHWLGANLGSLFDCSHPHLRSMAPYEEYERYMFPGKLAARSSEFKLYLALYFHREGIPAASMGAVAEPLAIALLRDLKMAGLRDWRATLAAFDALDGKLLEGVLTKP